MSRHISNRRLSMDHHQPKRAKRRRAKSKPLRNRVVLVLFVVLAVAFVSGVVWGIRTMSFESLEDNQHPLLTPTPIPTLSPKISVEMLPTVLDEATANERWNVASLISQTFKPNRLRGSSAMTETSKKLIAEGHLHLVGIYTKSPNTPLIGIFCHLNFALHKEDPSIYPMFRDLIEVSFCSIRSNLHTILLEEAVNIAITYDDKLRSTSDGNVDPPTYDSWSPAGFVFHESRCGSTLVANALEVAGEKHRVYSESSPIPEILRCDTCEEKTTVKNLKDAMFLMGRGTPSQPTQDTKTFFKLQSALSLEMKHVLKAHPSTPWMFVYRDSVQVMMSHIGRGPIGRVPICARKKSHPHVITSQILASHEITAYQSTDEEFCAAHLASICSNVLDVFEAPDTASTGLLVNYVGLIENLANNVLPNHFGVPLDEEYKQRVLAMGDTYSKARTFRSQEWEEDSAKKDDAATDAVIKASELIIYPYFEKLEAARKKREAGVIEERGRGAEI